MFNYTVFSGLLNPFQEYDLDVAKRVLGSVASIAAWIGGLFAGAGTLSWKRGWLSVALYLGLVAVGGIVIRRANPGLMTERAKWRRKDTKPFDRLFLRLMLPLVSIQPVAAGLDHRFGWWATPPALLWPGTVLFALSAALIIWCLAVNRHAETTVRIQTDRSHQVVTCGPYRVVRHPMYVGAVAMYPATALVWGSGAALGIGLAVGLLFVWRTGREDRTLQDELPGYREYAVRTRYRLVPGLW